VRIEVAALDNVDGASDDLRLVDPERVRNAVAESPEPQKASRGDNRGQPDNPRDSGTAGGLDDFDRILNDDGFQSGTTLAGRRAV
jgi:hypothetical protein